MVWCPCPTYCKGGREVCMTTYRNHNRPPPPKLQLASFTQQNPPVPIPIPRPTNLKRTTVFSEASSSCSKRQRGSNSSETLSESGSLKTGDSMKMGFTQVPQDNPVHSEHFQNSSNKLQVADDIIPNQTIIRPQSPRHRINLQPAHLNSTGAPVSKPDTVQASRTSINEPRNSSHDNTGKLDGGINSSNKSADLTGDPDFRFSLDLFLALANTSQEAYDNVRKALIRRHPGATIFSYDQIKSRIKNLADTAPSAEDMCINSCMAYTGPYKDLEECRLCSEPRHNATMSLVTNGSIKIPSRDSQSAAVESVSRPSAALHSESDGSRLEASSSSSTLSTVVAPPTASKAPVKLESTSSASTSAPNTVTVETVTTAPKPTAKITNKESQIYEPRAAITPRNLCGTEWKISNPNGTVQEFKDYFKHLSRDELKVFQERSKQEKTIKQTGLN